MPSAWLVNGTKKGALPIKVEKRPKGKTVTILSNVSKEPQALLTQVFTSVMILPLLPSSPREYQRRGNCTNHAR